jgi:5'-deoxynucleotidase YfbR-like HD superfamily hydrolase
MTYTGAHDVIFTKGDQRRGDWLQTYTGRLFYPGDPRPEDVDVEDIAHALSNVCRFAGHCREFYSVAQHSVIVSSAIYPALALHGLLHDAAEAYVHDITRPMKHLPEMAGYRSIEAAVEHAIFSRFGLIVNEEIATAIKAADNRALMTERRDLLRIQRAWTVRGEPLAEPIVPMLPAAAKAAFLRRFHELATATPEVRA